jgi:hypothetical protein
LAPKVDNVARGSLRTINASWLLVEVERDKVRYFDSQVVMVSSKTGEVVWFCGENEWECINGVWATQEVEGDGGHSG